ncbi:MAG: hypothetical protein HW421_2175 [Ignavibacteria bacterium]|nr:hypothetical protein [Ignavibacteria bacterium]
MNYSQKFSKAVTANDVNATITEALDLPVINNGIHRISIRFKDNNNKWSFVSDYVFFKTDVFTSDSSNIAGLEYWFDGNYSKKISKTVNSVNNKVLELLDLSELVNGFHRLSVRFKDNSNLWSKVNDYYFFKAGISSDDKFLITKYRYWFDSDTKNIVEETLPTPSDIVMISKLIDIKTGTPNEFPQAFYLQFQDNTGIWSAVYTKSFYPEPSFEVYQTLHTFSFKNTSNFAKRFKWDFGDGKTDTTINPTHTYKLPGVYTVTLKATNTLGSKDTFQVVEVKGLREVIANKGGNTGYVTVYLYGGGFRDTAKVWLEKNNTKYLDAELVRLSRLDALEARFNLFGKETGVYDIFVKLPFGDIFKLTQAFTIEQGKVAEPYINFTGRDKILFGRWQTYSINIGNNSNTDALGVPVYFLVTLAKDIEIDFVNLKVQMSKYWKTQKNYDEVNKIPDYLENEGYFGGQEKVRLYAFYIPVIPAGFSGQLNVRIKTQENFKAYVWLHSPMFEATTGGIIKKINDDEILGSVDKKTAACLRAVMFQAGKDGIAAIANELIPGVACANDILNTAFKPADYLAPTPTNPDYNRPKSWGETFWDWGGTIKDYTMTIAGCATDIFPITHVIKAGIAVVGVANNIYGGIQAGRDCYKKYSNGQTNVKAVSSFDPNEMVGPYGYKNQKYTGTEGKFNYKIYFENKPIATAPAQEVIILDTLDKSKFDFSSFSFGPFSFGGKSYSPLNGLKEFTIDIDSISKFNVLLKVNAKFDTVTGIVKWQYITLDKKTMDYPEDPDAGFLPPNKTSPEGEGFVSFDIKLINTLKNNDSIANQAKIIFDLNEPIFTNKYSNTLDFNLPKSKLTSIQSTQEKNNYRFFIDATDSLSGVRHYTIYASKNDSAYIPILLTNQNPFYYKCDDGITYKFYSIATDSVGNEEPGKTLYEVSTLNVSVKDNYPLLIENDISIYPNPVNSIINIEYMAQSLGILKCKIFDVYGNEILNIENETKNFGVNTFSINCENLNSGAYILKINSDDRIISKLVNIIK